MIVIGELSLWVALILSIWSAAIAFTGATLGRADLVSSGVRAIYMTLLMTALASAGLLVALFSHDFSIRHVASFSSRNLPTLFLASAVWAGRAGGLLFSALCLALVSTLVIWAMHRHSRLPRVAATLGLALALLLFTVCFAANPFARLDWIPQEGQGMPPQLQNLWASLYPPVLYAGAACLAAPIGLWIGAGRSVDKETRGLIRKWALAPWIMTTSAVLLGTRQAYSVVDVHASWLSHPLRSGSLVPWIIAIGLAGFLICAESEATRSRSMRVGAYVAILGLLLVTSGGIGRAFRELAGVTLTPGSSAQLLDPFRKRWSVDNLGVSRYDVLNRQVTAIALNVSIDGKSNGVVTSEMRQHLDSRGAPVHRPAIVTGVKGTWPVDLVVSLDDVDPGEAARLRLSFNPLVRLVWIGGILVLLGGCLIIYLPTRQSP